MSFKKLAILAGAFMTMLGFNNQAYAFEQPANPQIVCLAMNNYYEAGNQGKAGMIAISNVVMNRIKDSRFPKSPCEVVHQKNRGVCQFSWVCSRRPASDKMLYATALSAATKVYNNEVSDNTNGAKYFHNKSIRPNWSGKLKRTVSIGDHIFYRG
jgi:spore germination cell wall hydrolase CwlJ-like protein